MIKAITSLQSSHSLKTLLDSLSHALIEYKLCCSLTHLFLYLSLRVRSIIATRVYLPIVGMPQV